MHTTASSARRGPYSAIVFGNTMTSIDVSRSSSVNVAMRSPRLVYLRASAVTTPPTVRISPSRSSRRSVMPQSVWRASTFAAPMSGWSDT